MATYFGVNYDQLLMAVPFVIARFLRVNKSDEVKRSMLPYMYMPMWCCQ